MINLKQHKPLFSTEWKSKYCAILENEHLDKMEIHLKQFQEGKTMFELPYFNEEIKEDLALHFQPFLDVFYLKDETVIVKNLELIPFKSWLMVLGQRLTSASIRDERAILPTKTHLLKSCQNSYNHEITMAHRAWEKHIGRTDDAFWGEIKGNNQQKQEKVMKKISEILDNTTWWNVFFHYKHGYVYEVREKDGHGVRWSLENLQLIGFLEEFISED